MQGLWQHQREAVDFGRTRRDVLLHCGMGTGKSRMAIEIVRDLLADRPTARILLGCPKAVMAAWAKQFRAWFPGLRVVILDRGTSKQKDDIVRAAMADTTRPPSRACPGTVHSTMRSGNERPAAHRSG